MPACCALLWRRCSSGTITHIAENPVHVRDLHATVLHLLGMDHKRFTFKWQGLDMKLTGVEGEAQVVKDILA